MTDEEFPPFEVDESVVDPHWKDDRSERPMAWLKVVDLSSGAAGPFCAKLLADYGADVVKVEDTRRPDWARTYRYAPDRIVDPEQGALFLYGNTNKRGLALDLGTHEGRQVLLDVLADADILVEDWTHQEVLDAGLDFAALHALNPRLIVTSVTPFGRTGPFRDYKAHPLNVFHASGQGYLAPMNSPDKTREPVKGGGLVWEHDAGMASAIATLAALYWRENGGTGQHVDVSKQHAVMHLEKSQLRRYIDDGESPDRTGMGRLLETLVQGKDGNYVVVILSSQIQWVGLFEAMGKPEWGANPPFDTQAGRSANYLELRRRLQEWADGFTAEEIFHKIQACRSAAAPVYLAEHFMASDQVAARAFLVELDHPIVGRLRYPGRSGRFSEMSWTGTRGAPVLGQDTHEILAELGYSETEIADFELAGAVRRNRTSDELGEHDAAVVELERAGAARGQENSHAD